MMTRKILRIAVLLAALAPAARAALVSPSAQVQDSAGAVRQSFSSTERITLVAKVQNAAPGAGNIQFSFIVRDPLGSQRLSQTGNSAPASSVGAVGASLRVPVSQFYTTPGVYTLVIRAAFGAENLEATAQFTVLSPVITLTYPPNGARDLIDQPLTFRWVSSGATRYRVTVDDDQSFYNALFISDLVVSNFFAYPLNPTDVRQRLASGQVYYWKVEGLDFAGNVVARTEVPFSFTVKSQGGQATSRDLAIVGLERLNEANLGGPGALPMGVFVKNQGGRAESNIAVNLFADGAAVPTSPKRLSQIDPGKTERLVFPVRAPEEGKFTLVNAVIDFFDDNLQNNAMSKQVRLEEAARGRKLRPSEVWEIMRRFVTDTRVLAELEGYYAADASAEGLSEAELAELVLALKDGKGQVNGVRLKPPAE